jgi:hypothetical protein
MKVYKKPKVDISERRLAMSSLTSGSFAVNMSKNDNQCTLQATDAIPVDFCNFRKSGGFSNFAP